MSKYTDVPQVAIIILNWNNPSDTIACLDSVQRLEYANYRVLVVDNGSIDDSVIRIRTAHPDIEIIETGENLGYAGGNNVGVRNALEHQADYICILNNDTIIARDSLMLMVNEAESAASIGVVGPRIHFCEPSNMIFSEGSWIDWRRGTIHHHAFGQLKDETQPQPAKKPKDVDFIIGCCVLFKRSVLETIGLLNTRYYLNYEDVDWCVRAMRAGYRVRYVPQAVLWHHVSATLGQASPQNTYYMTRNSLLFFSTRAPGIWKCLSVVQILCRTLRPVLAWTVKPEYQNDLFRRKRAANLFALRDFFLKRFGKMSTEIEEICYGQ